MWHMPWSGALRMDTLRCVKVHCSRPVPTIHRGREGKSLGAIVMGLLPKGGWDEVTGIRVRDGALSLRVLLGTHALFAPLTWGPRKYTLPQTPTPPGGRPPQITPKCVQSEVPTAHTYPNYAPDKTNSTTAGPAARRRWIPLGDPESPGPSAMFPNIRCLRND